MTTDEYGIGTEQVCRVGLQEVSDMYVNSRRAESAAVVVNQFFALRPYLKGHHLQVGKLQPGFDRHAACAEANVPKDVLSRQVEGLQREQADGHLRNHLLPVVE